MLWTHHLFILSQDQVISTHGHTENDGGNSLETVDPLLPFGALASDIKHPINTQETREWVQETHNTACILSLGRLVNTSWSSLSSCFGKKNSKTGRGRTFFQPMWLLRGGVRMQGVHAELFLLLKQAGVWWRDVQGASFSLARLGFARDLVSAPHYNTDTLWKAFYWSCSASAQLRVCVCMGTRRVLGRDQTGTLRGPASCPPL